MIDRATTQDSLSDLRGCRRVGGVLRVERSRTGRSNDDARNDNDDSRSLTDDGTTALHDDDRTNRDRDGHRRA